MVSVELGERWRRDCSLPKRSTPAGNDGLFFGNAGAAWVQFVAVVATWIVAIVGTYILLSIVKAIMGLRVSDDDERMGLDLSQHNERAYEFSSASGLAVDERI